ncbi:hypothetical protein [Pseudoduganella namucuonensis]|uniref:Uncharacterized protein n=1 Tax=Pseudoduganella namucuonensis TaxID=1035707 RepID=A0A1I7G696_9BURK|nr:hypothetical protein [Pseudoduganella namucuonensis]SFU43990.1 hypothetical protein SAMN05216552_100381 [Pseudoduganella namucuonensis]
MRARGAVALLCALAALCAWAVHSLLLPENVLAAAALLSLC